jgi:alpha-glucosidase
VRPQVPNPQEFGIDPLANSEYRCTHIAHSWLLSGEREIRLHRRHDGYTPALDFMFIAVLHDPSESFTGPGSEPLQEIRRGGSTLTQITGGSPEQLADRLWHAQQTSWYFNRNVNISFIKLVSPQVADVLTIRYRP